MTQNALVKFLLMCVLYFAPITNLIVVVLIFIAVDFCTGIYASWKHKDAIVSSRLRKTLEKFVFYSISIVIAYMFQIEIMPWLGLTNLVAGFIAAIELLSIYENVKKITGLNIVERVKDYIMSNLLKFKKDA